MNRIENVIYCIANNHNGNLYIGSARDFRNRIQIHIKQLKNNKHHSIHLQRAWNKYGQESFEFSVIENVGCASDLIKREQYWINELTPEYNICKIAGSSLGIKRSQETIEKVRAKKIGIKHSAEDNLRKSIMQGGSNHHNYGKELSDKTILKKSNSMKEYYKTHEHHNKGKKNMMSDSSVKQMRINSQIPIIQLSKGGLFMKNWPSSNVAGQSLGIFSSNITACLKGKCNTAGGFKWVYDDRVLSKYAQRLYNEWIEHKKIIIATDFDGTLQVDENLANKKEVDRVLKLLKSAYRIGAHIVIFTATFRSRFDYIRKYCKDKNIPISSINENPIPLKYGNDGKIYYNINLCDRSGLSQSLDILEETINEMMKSKRKPKSLKHRHKK